MSSEVANTLLIGGSFFGYSRYIIEEMKRTGRRVLWFDDRPETDPVSKALVRLSPALIAGRINSHVDAIIAAAREADIKEVLIVKGEGLSPANLRRLRAALPGARFVLYFWDSYRNMSPDSRAKVDVCDRTFSFDPDDSAADHRLVYRPLFYVPDCEALPHHDMDIDLLWVGTMHTDRYAIIERLRRTLDASTRFDRHQYFAAPFLFLARKIFDPAFWGSSRTEFVFEPVGRAELLRLMTRSKAMLDIERPVQCGFTIRTIETLGACRKLVTTNAKVREADFYDPNNVAVINRDGPRVPDRFWETPYRAPPPEIVGRYRLSAWLAEVLAP